MFLYTFADANIRNNVETRFHYTGNCCLSGRSFVYKNDNRAKRDLQQHTHQRQQGDAQTRNPLRAEHGCHGAQGEPAQSERTQKNRNKKLNIINEMNTKKYLWGATMLAACLTMTSCGNKTQGENSANEKSGDIQGAKIAYVELDSLMNQYQLYKDYSEVLTRKGTNIQNTLGEKQRTLEAHAASLQKKYENNGLTTRDELERAQNNLQREQADLQELAERLNGEFNAEQARINEEARDSIQSFLKRYNEDKKYDYVMIKAGDNLLIANPQYNITQDIVEGLNKNYKITPEMEKAMKGTTESSEKSE